MSYLEIVLALSVPIGLIGLYVMGNYFVKNMKIYVEVQKKELTEQVSAIIVPSFMDLLHEATENPEMQSKLYQVGGLIGAGVAQGTGLNKLTGGGGAPGRSTTPRGGLIEQLIGPLVQSFLQGRMGGGGQSRPSAINPQSGEGSIEPAFK